MGAVVDLVLKEGSAFRSLKVPVDVVEDLLSDRLCQPDVDRILRMASPVSAFTPKAGSILVDFTTKTATCLDTRLDTIGATWTIQKPELTLGHY